MFGVKEEDNISKKDYVGNPRMGMQPAIDNNQIDLSDSILASNDKRKSMVNPSQLATKNTVTSKRKKPSNLMPAPKNVGPSMQ